MNRWGWLALSIALPTMVTATGCKNQPTIPGTEVPDTEDNRQIIAVLERYRTSFVSRDAAAVLDRCETVLVAVPTQHIRATLGGLAGHVPKAVAVVSLAKGIEQNTGRRPSEVIQEVLGGDDRVYALSGPSHAEEIAHGVVVLEAVQPARQRWPGIERIVRIAAGLEHAHARGRQVRRRALGRRGGRRRGLLAGRQREGSDQQHRQG